MATTTYPTTVDPELEKQYSPSKWSRRGDSASIIETFFSTMQRLSDAARNSVSCTRDRVYGEKSPGEKLDIYRGERSTEESEVFVFIHGGYWQTKECNKDTCASPVRPLTSRGAVVVMVGYDLAPKATLATMVEQVERAVAYVIDQFPRSRGIYVGGHSAGGHLSAMMMSVDWQGKYRSDLVKGFCLISGIFDVTPLVRTNINSPLGLSLPEARQASPVQYLAEACRCSAMCEVIVAVGEDESPEFRRQSAEYARGLEEGGVKVHHVEVEGEDHFSFIEKLGQENSFLMQMIMNLMNLKDHFI